MTELAAMMPRNVSNCYVYLGSCLTLADSNAGAAIVKETGVSAVVGYSKKIDWIEGAAFEVILLSLMANHNQHPKSLYDLIMYRYGGLARRLGLVVISNRDVWRANWG